MRRPSTNLPYQGEIRRPPSPSPGPEITTSAPKWKFALLLNTAAVRPPSPEKLQLCRLANPTHSVSITSVISIEAGKLFVVVTVEIGQSLKVRVTMIAPFTEGVARATLPGSNRRAVDRMADHGGLKLAIRFMAGTLPGWRSKSEWGSIKAERDRHGLGSLRRFVPSGT